MNTETADRAMAWHQMGTTLPTGITSAEDALRESGLANWNVRKEPIYLDDGLLVPGKFATVRDTPSGGKEVMGVVGKQFHILQNEDHIPFLDAFADETGATFDTAGTTTGSEETFISMKLPSMVNVLGNTDRHDLYVTALNSHVGSRSFTLMVTPVRVVCTNMQSAALGDASNSFRVRHTSGATRTVVNEARQMVDRVFTYLDDFQKHADILASKKMTDDEFYAIIQREFGSESTAPHVVARVDAKFDALMYLFTQSETQEGIRNTAWAGYNALVEYFDHYSETRGDNPNRSRAINSVLDPSAKRRALRAVVA